VNVGRWRTVALTGSLCLAAAPVQAEAVTYQLTPTHSFVHFEWSHGGLSTLSGRFNKLSGRIVLDRSARSGQGTVELRLDSVSTGRPALDTALRQGLGAADGGDAAVARFDIESMQFDGDRPQSARGRLRWQRAPLVVELQAEHFNCYFNPLLRREVCGGDFNARVDPASIGLALDPSFGLVGAIELRIQVEAIRQEPGS
jgi:polyisoprenoid-binding protein YceI